MESRWDFKEEMGKNTERERKGRRKHDEENLGTRKIRGESIGIKLCEEVRD